MNPNQALWEKGDFTQIAEFVRQSEESFVQSLGITPGSRVLDLGCGDGTTAIPAALLGADVTGIDISRNLITAANQRAQSVGVSGIRFQHGDACHLEGVPDRSFDLTLSAFGAMFAPKPYDVAREMVRVTRPGGRIAMANWIPGDPTFISQVLLISSQFTPPAPEGSVSPMLWGMDTHVLDRFCHAGIPRDKISLARETLYLRSPDKSPQQLIDLLRIYYGPTMNAFDNAESTGQAVELYAQLVELANAHNQSRDAGTLIPATFLHVTVNV